MLLFKYSSGRSTSVLLLMFCCIFLGCDSGKDKTSQAPQRTPKASAKPKVALIMKSLANEFFSTMADGAKKHQSDHSDQYELIVNGIKDERDLSRQSALVEEMVSSGVNAIVIAPADSKALIPALRRAQKAGIVVINIDNKLDETILQQEKLSIPLCWP